MADIVNSSKVVTAVCDSDEARWQAVINRDPATDGLFFFSVKTTGVYCRTVCPARRPLRKNVWFHETCQEAEGAGFRPCQRCRPLEQSLAERQASVVTRICRSLEQAETMPRLDELAAAAGISPYHLHRLFKQQTGITPKQYAAAHRARRVRNDLTQCRTVTEAIYGAGYNANSRFYESSNKLLGMTPSSYRAGGQDITVRFAVGQCWLGSILVAASQQGICAIFLGDDPEELTHQLQNLFHAAELVGGHPEFETWVATVVGFVSDPSRGLNLPLDIRGTAFQHQVWQALRQVPVGSTATYSEIAARIGRPRSVRAVASACAANAIAVAIPCHRVVRLNGSLSGYRWGIERKRQLIEHERE